MDDGFADAGRELVDAVAGFGGLVELAEVHQSAWAAVWVWEAVEAFGDEFGGVWAWHGVARLPIGKGPINRCLTA
ncbi:hypothetical protein MBRA_00710 [Mycobacterium branderi]|uniref:Uncharacterized protein n=1 Tax=Mycobacterium branderi TaxID=43348 RepID=A0ABM7KG02_9MYCO|nr:hypothetical protein MBRA_00030 [Mycobacterium branderi]BBZ09876.1 hypothetical protein MBRA_00710 [Mycobacterium branderi]